MQGTLLGNYRILGQLGEGGMGVVYVGRHETIGRRVAIKVLLPELSSNEAMVRRFFNEAQAATAIRNPGIVQVFDFGQTPDGRAYFVMELLEGEPLTLRIKRRRHSFEECCRIGRQVANVLSAAHTAGITHRDLKPDNLFLIRDPEVIGGERVKVLDFGIAKLAGEAHAAGVKTRTGLLMGTPDYMSPEQCRNASSAEARSDIYSLGCILFELGCGRPPFVGEGMGDVVAAHLHVPPPNPQTFAPAMPGDLSALITQMLSKRPEGRPQTMAEVSHSLDGILAASGGGGVRPATPSTLPAQPPPPVAGRAPTAQVDQPTQIMAEPAPFPQAPISPRELAQAGVAIGRAPTPQPVIGRAPTPQPVIGRAPTPQPARAPHDTGLETAIRELDPPSLTEAATNLVPPLDPITAPIPGRAPTAQSEPTQLTMELETAMLEAGPHSLPGAPTDPMMAPPFLPTGRTPTPLPGALPERPSASALPPAIGRTPTPYPVAAVAPAAAPAPASAPPAMGYIPSPTPGPSPLPPRSFEPPSAPRGFPPPSPNAPMYPAPWARGPAHRPGRKRRLPLLLGGLVIAGAAIAIAIALGTGGSGAPDPAPSGDAAAPPEATVEVAIDAAVTVPVPAPPDATPLDAAASDAAAPDAAASEPTQTADDLASECRGYQVDRNWTELEQCAAKLKPLDAQRAADFAALAAEGQKSAPQVAAIDEALRNNKLLDAKAALEQISPQSRDYPILKRKYDAAEYKAIAALAGQLELLRGPDCTKYNGLLGQKRASAPPRVAAEAARQKPCPPSKAEIDSLVAAGQAHLAAGRYAEALAAYDAAYRYTLRQGYSENALKAACNAKNLPKAKFHWQQQPDYVQKRQLKDNCKPNGITEAMLNGK